MPTTVSTPTPVAPLALYITGYCGPLAEPVMHSHGVFPSHGFPTGATCDGRCIVGHRAMTMPLEILLAGEGDEFALRVGTLVAPVR
jgi:hypothetical protein